MSIVDAAIVAAVFVTGLGLVILWATRPSRLTDHSAASYKRTPRGKKLS